MNTEFLAEQYRFEVERRHQLAESLSTPIGILTGLASVLGVMATNHPWSPGTLTIIFAGLVLLSITALLLTVFFLARSFWGQWYMLLPKAGILKAYNDQLQEYAKQVSADSTGPSGLTFQPDMVFEEYLRAKLAEAADFNAERNDFRAGLLHKANGFLLAMLAFTLLAGVLFVLQYRLKTTSDTQKGSQNVEHTKDSSPTSTPTTTK